MTELLFLSVYLFSLFQFKFIISWRWNRVEVCCSSVLFSSVPWTIGSSGGHEGWFSRDPLPVISAGGPWAVLAWADMSTLWCCPSSISSADDGVVHLPECPEGWLWGGCRAVWHARNIQVSCLLVLHCAVNVVATPFWVIWKMCIYVMNSVGPTGRQARRLSSVQNGPKTLTMWFSKTPWM